MAIDKVFYNKSSADSLGWTPEWFGVKYHDEKNFYTHLVPRVYQCLQFLWAYCSPRKKQTMA